MEPNPRFEPKAQVFWCGECRKQISGEPLSFAGDFACESRVRKVLREPGRRGGGGARTDEDRRGDVPQETERE